MMVMRFLLIIPPVLLLLGALYVSVAGIKVKFVTLEKEIPSSSFSQ